MEEVNGKCLPLRLKSVSLEDMKLSIDNKMMEEPPDISIQAKDSSCSTEMSVCRACTSEDGPMESLFSFHEASYPTELTLSEMFTACTSLQVEEGDELPKLLCSQCIAQLQQWFIFKETSVKSDITLREALAKRKIDKPEHFNVLDDILDDVKEADLDQNIEDSIAETSSVYILVVGEDDREEQQVTEVVTKDQCFVNTLYEDDHEITVQPMIIKEDSVSMEDRFVDDREEENLCSVKKDHAYAYKMKSSSQPKNYYHCRWCLQIFTNFKRYRTHLLQEHESVVECKRCYKTFQSDDTLAEHSCLDVASHAESLAESSELHEAISLKRRNSRKDPVRCTHCNKMFKSLWRLKTHMLIHTGERPHMCHVCGKRFSQKQHLKTHYFTHSGIKNYICEMCGKKFATVSFLKNHMRHHDDKIKKHLCSQCPKTFFLPSELKAHMRTHTGERPFKCMICSKTFRLKAAMKSHQLRHGSCDIQDAGRPYWCNMCNRTFTREIYLENHIASIHVQENRPQKFVCKMCGREFRTKNTLKMHSIRHTSSRPFLCTICNRNFKEEVNLVAHIKFHERPKPFECETCHKRFIDRCALRVHNRTHTGERPFACELCNKRFTVKRSLEAHMRCHTGERPFVCSVCNNTFTQRCSLQTHMLLMHNCEP